METKSEAMYGGVNGYGYGNDYMSWLTANQISEVRRDVAKSEADIKHMLGDGFCSIEKSIGDSECAISKEVGDAECNILRKVGDSACEAQKDRSDIAQRQSSHLSSVERDLQNRIHETRFILSKEIGDKNDRTIDILGAGLTDVRNQLRYFETSTAEKFCDLKTQGLLNTQKILDEMAKNKYDALKDELDETRAYRHADKHAYNFALAQNEINSLKAMVNSVEQTQRFSSKTVQFGAGNVAIPTQTANQA